MYVCVVYIILFLDIINVDTESWVIQHAPFVAERTKLNVLHICFLMNIYIYIYIFFFFFSTRLQNYVSHFWECDDGVQSETLTTSGVTNSECLMPRE
ncbi:hypothetical protein EPR50_G00098180 [Perca flavescens]|uniref:Uncharacterized protein n=1 Tax=Perca flavescens TaxID=8167 RepID=A0A484CZW9_PERFV|nr:hypothetical protein EPR50_G00098180 [Perca flavescens]